MSEVPKRGHGRPRGTKNKPGTTGVGRPRKDGRAPQPRQRHDTEDANDTATSHGVSVTSTSTSTSRRDNPNPSSNTPSAPSHLSQRN
ncbi:uncharacterized protein EDB91DRAFT_676147 [Suillus paluster]|uniref:uncharacterized protein n=1 Tax=Suillus paluster TaxID=48578 RepID=UPI001B862653|nr:uncharacterized protein EDB91DRAFT_676147 [Suillus paluster]KAG1732184.1 hypothetical protein EDB91DRAFT_676147 [Suillus paluster]